MKSSPSSGWELVAVSYLLLTLAVASCGAYFLGWVLAPSVKPNVGLAAYNPPSATRLIPVPDNRRTLTVAQSPTETNAAPSPEPSTEVRTEPTHELQQAVKKQRPAKKARTAHHRSRAVVHRSKPRQIEITQRWVVD